MKLSKKFYKLSIFVVKILIGIFDKGSDLLYFLDQKFLYQEMKDGMLFFLILSPAIQTIAWSMLLAQIKITLPKPSISERVKQSKSTLGFICNFIISVLEYYFHLLILMLRYLPQSLGITFLQQLKIFPICLFGYTYYRYQTILTRDLMKNLAVHLMVLKENENEVNQENLLEQFPQINENQNNENNQEAIKIKSAEQSINQNNFKGPNLKINHKTFLPQNTMMKQIQMSKQPSLQMSKQPSLQINGSQHTGQSDSDQSPVNSKIMQRQQSNIVFSDKSIEFSASNDLKQLGARFFNKHRALNQSLLPSHSQISIQDKQQENNNSGSLEQSKDELKSFNLFPNQQKRESITLNNFPNPNKKLTYQQSINFKNRKESDLEGHVSRIKLPKRNSQSKGKFEGGLERSTIGNLFKMSMMYQRKSKDFTPFKLQNGTQSSQNSSLFSFVGSKNQNNFCNETDLLLDANIIPNFEALITDYNLEQFLLITDVIEAVFEALPMTALQYVNNGINNSWVNPDGSINWFVEISFITSLITIILHSISLLKILYDDNIKIFYCTLQFLSKYNQQSQKEEELNQNLKKKEKNFNSKTKKKEAQGFGRIFPMSSEIRIEKKLQLKKLIMLRSQACEEIKSIKYIFNNDQFYAHNIHDYIYKSITSLKKIQYLEIEFNGNNFTQNLSPLIFHIIGDLPDLSSLLFSFQDNSISEESQKSIYSVFNSWILNKDGNIEELLFNSQAIFIWRCPSFKNIYAQKQKQYRENFESLCTSSFEKQIVELFLPGKEFTPEECEDLAESISTWYNCIISKQKFINEISFKRNHLKHFQLMIEHIPLIYQDLVVESLSQNQSLFSSLITTQVNGLLYRKGFSSNYHQKDNSFILNKQQFYFNFDAMQFTFAKELKQITAISIEKACIQIEGKEEMNDKLKDSSIKILGKLVTALKGINSLELYLKNNDLGHSSGLPVGECIESFKNLIDLHLDLSNNRIGTIGFSKIVQSLIKGDKKFRKIYLDVNNNNIQNDGISELIFFLKQQGINSSSFPKQPLKLNKFLRKENSNDQCTIEEEKIGRLSHLTLDLSNNIIEKSTINDILEQLSSIQSLSLLGFVIKGNELNLSKQFDLAQLEYLEELNIAFQSNQFSSLSLDFLFNSLNSIPLKISSFSFEIINNNFSDKNIPFGNFLRRLQNLRFLKLIFSQNGLFLTRLQGFDQYIMQAQLLQNLYLDLSDCNFGYQGIKELSKNIYLLLSLEVVNFNFSNNHEFNDDCSQIIINVLQPLQRLSSLSLNYQNTSITDIAIKILSKKIIEIKSLTQVQFNFQQNKTTEAALRFLVEGFISAQHIAQPHFKV